MMERQGDMETMMQELKARDGELETLTKQVAENNIRLSRILEIHGYNEIHDYNIDQLDARLKRIEERHNLQ